jgi:hypothetical protein
LLKDTFILMISIIIIIIIIIIVIIIIIINAKRSNTVLRSCDRAS